MTESELRCLLSQQLQENVREKGWVLYSGLDALAKSDFYVMGYNPAVDEANSEIAENKIFQQKWSAYTHQCWNTHLTSCEHLGPDGTVAAKYLRPHQRNVIQLARLLKTPLHEIFSANAIFMASRDAMALKNSRKLWCQCWAVHQSFLAVVRPKWIICLGNSADRSSFQLLAKKAGVRWQYCSDRRKESSQYLDGKWFSGQLEIAPGDYHPVNVLGVPHPSWFPLSSDLKSFVEGEVIRPVSRGSSSSR